MLNNLALFLLGLIDGGLAVTVWLTDVMSDPNFRVFFDALYVVALGVQLTTCPMLAILVVRSRASVSRVIVPSIFRWLKVIGLSLVFLAALWDVSTFGFLQPDIRPMVWVARVAGAMFFAGLLATRLAERWDEIGRSSAAVQLARSVVHRIEAHKR